MPHYQVPNDPSPHFLDDAAFEHLLPAGSIQISDAEAEAMRVASLPVIDPKDAIRAQITSMEQSQIMPRATREFMLLSMQSMFTPEQLTLNPGYVAVKAFDDQIAALRAQL